MKAIEGAYTLEMLSRFHGINEMWRLDRFKIGREGGRSRERVAQAKEQM